MARTLALAVAAATAVNAAQVTPVQKVIEMLNDMAVKAVKDRKDEAVQYSAYQQFCQDTSAHKRTAIEKAADAIERQEADIAKGNSDAAILTGEINELAEDMSRWSSDSKAAREVRGKEKADYTATHNDYTESIDAIDRAITVLKRQDFDRAQNQEALLQVATDAMWKKSSSHAQRVVTNFLQSDNDVDVQLLQEVQRAQSGQPAVPEAHGYEFQSTGVVNMLEQLNDKFRDEITALEKEELNSKHAHEMIQQDLEGQTQGAQESHDRKSALRGERQQFVAKTQGEYADTTASKKADETYLRDLVSECAIKKEDFGKRQQLRLDEIEAIKQASEVLSSDTLAGHAEKYLPQLLQKSKKSVKTSFIQFNSNTNSDTMNMAPIQSRVATFLKSRAEESHSKVLSLIAEHMSEDPFNKVKKMIRDMLIRLKEEATQETEHKGWCDTELGTNKITRENKAADVDDLTATVEELNADIAQTATKITELSQAIVDLDAAVKTATADRNEEHARNTQTIADAKEAQVGVAQAITVLSEFYAQAEGATALIQVVNKQPEKPDIFETGYKGMQEVKGGVMGMLEVIQSDFVRLEAETSSSELANAAAYKKFMNESEVDKAVKQTTIEHKTRKNSRNKNDVQTAKRDLSSTQSELDAAMKYYDKLKPTCVSSGITYEERVARREDEIQSLKEALEILTNGNVD